MRLDIIFHGRVSDDGSRIEFEQAERFQRKGHLKKLAGRQVEIVIRPFYKRRSDRQNKWHWGVAVPLIASELGYDKHEHEDLHYALVAKCFGVHFDPRTKQEIPNVRSSSLTTAQFSELMEWEVRWAASEHGINVPLPGEAD